MVIKPLTAEFSWRQFIHFYLSWVCWLPVLQDFTCCHQTYNYSRPWPAPPGEPLFASQNHAHSGRLPTESGWTTQFNGNYQVCHHCMLTQSTQVGCSCAWALAFTQTHKLVQFMPTQNPHKHYDEGEGLCWKPVDFFPESALCIWWFSHIWTISWENCPFSSKWNRLWCLKASLSN